jgi:hypothetical protein
VCLYGERTQRHVERVQLVMRRRRRRRAIKVMCELGVVSMNVVSMNVVVPRRKAMRGHGRERECWSVHLHMRNA